MHIYYASGLIDWCLELYALVFSMASCNLQWSNDNAQEILLRLYS